MAAVFIVGVLFIFITVGRIRELIMDDIPIFLNLIYLKNPSEKIQVQQMAEQKLSHQAFL